MPGFSEVTPVEPLKPGLLCLECQLLLRDPLQTAEGDRICRSCYEDIKRTGESKAGIKLGEEQCYPDRAASKEIRQLQVKCGNHSSGCTWQGKVQEFEDHDCQFRPVACPNEGCNEIITKSELKNHLKNKCGFRVVSCKHCKKKLKAIELEGHYVDCPEFPVKCERCSQSVRKSAIEDHKDYHCVYIECCCGDLIKRKNVEAHFREEGALFKHINSLHIMHKRLLSTHRDIQRKLEERTELSEASNVAKGEISRVETELKSLKDKFETRLLLLERKFNEFDSLRGDVQATRHDCAQLQEASRTAERRLDSHDERLKQVQNQQAVAVRSKTSGASRYSESYSDSRLGAMERRMEELERQNKMLNVHVSELELQLQASLASTHNGSFLWRIPDVGRRRRDAVEERITSIYSPPFYTGRNGYKMCVRAYLNGDGIGFRSHLSLFFVLMRGEYDPLLKWPFENKVSLILVDQDHRKHIVQTFKPTPESSSFKRPSSDMNVASGCPQFCKNDVLTQDNYIKDDIMYIKCIVDVSRIFHP